jgi:hypothetical protein
MVRESEMLVSIEWYKSYERAYIVNTLGVCAVAYHVVRRTAVSRSGSFQRDSEILGE